MTILQGHRFPHTVADPLFTIMLMLQQQMEEIKLSKYILWVVQKKGSPPLTSSPVALACTALIVCQIILPFITGSRISSGNDCLTLNHMSFHLTKSDAL